MPKKVNEGEKKVSIQVAVLPTTRDTLKEMAMEDRRTLSEYVNIVLEKYIEQNKKQA